MPKYPMDPYKFEAKDIKRRLNALEKAFTRLLARYDRMILKQVRDDRTRQTTLDELERVVQNIDSCTR